jgi:hypothetical protein
MVLFTTALRSCKSHLIALNAQLASSAEVAWLAVSVLQDSIAIMEQLRRLKMEPLTPPRVQQEGISSALRATGALKVQQCQSNVLVERILYLTVVPRRLVTARSVRQVTTVSRESPSREYALEVTIVKTCIANHPSATDIPTTITREQQMAHLPALTALLGTSALGQPLPIMRTSHARQVTIVQAHLPRNLQLALLVPTTMPKVYRALTVARPAQRATTAKQGP